MESKPTLWQRFFSVYLHKETYKNFLYLFLAFPFGIFYFVFLIVGFSVGISLFILWIGILILVGTLAMSWLFSVLERILAVELLDAHVGQSKIDIPSKSSIWQRGKAYLSNSFLWRGLAFLGLKFPIGIAVFIVWITLLSISLGLIAAPFTLPWLHIENFWLQIASLPAALFSFVLGIFLLTVTLHIFNLLVRPLKLLAEAMLKPEHHQS
jgi:hypothetical protein